MLKFKKAALLVLSGGFVMALGISCLPNIGGLATGLLANFGL